MMILLSKFHWKIRNFRFLLNSDKIKKDLKVVIRIVIVPDIFFHNRFLIVKCVLRSIDFSALHGEVSL